MPILIMLLGLFAAGAYWYFRVRSVATLFEMADDVRLAARRFSFQRRASVHPVDATEDPRPLGAGTAAAIAEMAGPMTEAKLAALRREAARAFGTRPEETDDIVTFGRWLAGQCGGPDEAARRLTPHPGSRGA